MVRRLAAVFDGIDRVGGTAVDGKGCRAAVVQDSVEAGFTTRARLERSPYAETMSDSTEQTPAAPDPETVALAAKLFDLARAGDTAALEGYVDAGVSATLTNESGDTLVMLAAYHGHTATVEMLLARGGDANQANDKGQTPLAGAVFKGAEGVVRALLAGGADPAAGFPSAIDAARMFGKTEMLPLFEGR